MIMNPQIQSYYTNKKKQATVMIISCLFSPSSFESYDCKITMQKKLTCSKWDIDDIWILNVKRKQL